MRRLSLLVVVLAGCASAPSFGGARVEAPGRDSDTNELQFQTDDSLNRRR